MVVVFETIDTGREAVGVEIPEGGGTGRDFSFLTTTDLVEEGAGEEGLGGSLNPLLRLGGERDSSSS